MSYLKRKIKKAVNQRSQSKPCIEMQPSPAFSENASTTNSFRSLADTQPARSQQTCSVKPDESPPKSKNIVKNYGKAMCSFAGSKLALPYLELSSGKKWFNIDAFQKHARSQMRGLDSLQSVQALFYVRRNDNEDLITFKKVFQEISIIFIKYFSVNWIFQGRMSHKEAHLRARFKMLRRVREPEYFTYFKQIQKKNAGI